MSELIEIESFKKVIPKGLQGSVTPEIVGMINDMLANEGTREAFRDNVFGYTHVLKEGKFKMEDYIRAIKYVTYKLMDNTNIDAYVKTFPDRYQRLVTQGSSAKDISAYVAGYHKTKLVQLILEQCMKPVHLVNMDLYQKALNVQAELMLSSNSDMVRMKAAECLLNQLKAPEASEVNVNIGIKEDKTLLNLKETMRELAIAQQQMLTSSSVNLKDVAHSVIVNAEYSEVGDE